MTGERKCVRLLEVRRISVDMSYDCYVLCSLQGSGDARFISAKKSILYSVVPHLVRECESTLYKQFSVYIMSPFDDLETAGN